MNRKLTKILSEEIENIAKQGNHEPFENPNVIASRQYRNAATPKEFFNDVVDSNESEEDITENKRNRNMKKLVKLTEKNLHRIIENSVKRVLREGFEDDFNQARDNHISRGGMFGMELKNSEGDWEYGDVTFDPNSNTMSCMGATIQVDPDMTVDQNLEALYDELMNNGYSDD